MVAYGEVDAAERICRYVGEVESCLSAEGQKCMSRLALRQMEVLWPLGMC